MHDKELERLVSERAPGLLASHGIAILTVAEMLILVCVDPTRIRSEAALAKLCGVCPIPASSGKTHRFRLTLDGKRGQLSGRISSRDELMDRVYDDHRIVNDRMIDSHVKKLRRKLEIIMPDAKTIQAVYGLGYKLILTER